MAKIRQEGDHYVLDFREGGYRQRIRYSTKTAAKAALDLFEQKKMSQRLGLIPEFFPDSMELKEAIYLYAQGRENIVSFGREKSCFERLYDFLQDHEVTRLGEVKTHHLVSFQQKRLGEVSASTVVRDFVTYRAFFNKCVSMKLISIQDNPMLGVERPQVVEAVRSTWTDEQVDMVLEALPQWARDITAFFVMTGVRNIEAARLNWCDVSFKDKQATVMSWKNARSGRRRVPLPSGAIDLLTDIYRRAKADGHFRSLDPVFRNAQGKRFVVDHHCKVFAKVRAELGLPKDLQLYGIRHTFASKLSENNVSNFTIKGLMGHSQIRTTERYVHTKDIQLVEASEMVQRRLKIV